MTHHTATYVAIKGRVKQQSGFVPKTCWIAHVKELNGLPVAVAYNRHDPSVRRVSCPPSKRIAIESAFRSLALL